MHYLRLIDADRVARETFKKYHSHYPEHLPREERKQFRNINKVLGSYRKTKVPCSCPYC